MMRLSDIKTLKEVSEEYNILPVTLKKRLKAPGFGMIEGEDYKSLGERQATILSPSGIEKITKNKGVVNMVGTVVDYSKHDSSVHFIKILSGEKVCEVYPVSFPEDIKIDMQVEFNLNENTYEPLN